METQCTCGKWWEWFIQPFGKTMFTVLCSACGKNATAAAEEQLGINNKDDSYEMAVNHLELARIEHAEKCPENCCYGSTRENCRLGIETAKECKSPS